MWPDVDKFLWSLLGAIIGGSFVAWIGAYYSEKGKRLLVQEEWPKLLAEAQEKAHAEEAGKRLATKEDLDSVVVQVRAVTRETEVIKGEISTGIWKWQWLVNQKRDLYDGLFKTIDELLDSWDEEDMLARRDVNALEYGALREPVVSSRIIVERRFRSLVTFANVLLNQNAISALFDYADLEARFVGLNHHRRQEILANLKVSLVQAAKQDLS